MNLPNKLTIARIILTPIFMWALISKFPLHYFVALLVFIGASLTDLFDGKIARERGLVTDFGKFLDPLADKMLTTAAFIGFIALDIGEGVVWITFIVLLREFAVSSIRLIASTTGGKVIAANILGKLKTVFQMVAIIFALTSKQLVQILGMFNVPDSILGPMSVALSFATTLLLWISAGMCAISGIVYIAQNKDLIKDRK